MALGGPPLMPPPIACAPRLDCILALRPGPMSPRPDGCLGRLSTLPAGFFLPAGRLAACLEAVLPEDRAPDLSRWFAPADGPAFRRCAPAATWPGLSRPCPVRPSSVLWRMSLVWPAAPPGREGLLRLRSDALFLMLWRLFA